jgi:hypothetical protein
MTALALALAGADLITNSRVNAFNTCARLHHYKYELGYRPVVTGLALEFGILMHAGLEGWWLAFAQGKGAEALEQAYKFMAEAIQRCETADEFDVLKAQVLMAGYHARWAEHMDEYEVIVVEGKFAAPLVGPHGKRARGLKVAGKLDVLVRRRSDRTVWLVEHKTSSADLSAGSIYWQRLRMDGQVSMYFAGALALGYAPDGCLYDVIAKIDQRPLKATPEADRKYTKPVIKAGVVVEPARLYAKQREADETFEEFKERITALMAEKPDEYFGRAEVVRLDSELEESNRDTYETALMIRDGLKAQRHPRNPDACFRYNRVCEFYPVCSGAASLDDRHLYERLENVHPELED